MEPFVTPKQVTNTEKKSHVMISNQIAKTSSIMSSKRIVLIVALVLFVKPKNEGPKLVMDAFVEQHLPPRPASFTTPERVAKPSMIAASKCITGQKELGRPKSIA